MAETVVLPISCTEFGSQARYASEETSVDTVLSIRLRPNMASIKNLLPLLRQGPKRRQQTLPAADYKIPPANPVGTKNLGDTTVRRQARAEANGAS